MFSDKIKILENAQKYILKGRFKKAIKEYLSLIEASPEDKRLYLKLSDLYLKIGENEKAIKEYLKLADLYAKEQLHLQAISVYKRVLSINPKHIEALHQIAKLYLHEGFVGNAKIYYQNILEINPHDSETLEALRNIETQQQPKKIEPTIPFREPPLPPHRPPFRGETAEEKSNQPPSLTMPSIALSSKPEPFPSDGDFEVHYHLGIAYKEMELYDQAISEFELASADLSKTFDCDIMIGSCYMDKGDYNKSIEYYKMASEIREISTKRLAWLQFHLGLAYEASEMFPEALKAFELVLEMDPTFSRVEEKIKKLKDFSK